ncbi:MAG TPA: helix-turn-helix domain-containing protein [Solirubrobacterales bacterium]|nr:helix-turn-helix domain-containing protein [Solirubrobacterales bacterium]
MKFVKALAHPLRAHMLSILNERVASPNQLARELDEGLSQVSYHIKVLRDYECIELVKTEPRRGAVEHFYRATRRALIDDESWGKLSPSVKEGISVAMMRMITERVNRALESGTFFSRDESHLSNTPVVVDEQGWQDLTALLNRTLDAVLEIQVQSAGRLAEARQEGISATIAMLGFESAPPEPEPALEAPTEHERGEPSAPDGRPNLRLL